VLVNGSATAMTCTLTTSTSCSDLANTAAMSAGDTVTVRTTAVAGPKPADYTIELQ
jgi:hypothetical protein